MKTLYLRMVITYILIALMSSILALLGANFYYQKHLKDYNEQKILHIAQEMRTLYSHNQMDDYDTYFKHIAQLGFHIYLVNGDLQGDFYGAPFRDKKIETNVILSVLNGNTYIPKSPFVTGLFENSVRHSIGIPMDINEQPYALFVRPNIKQQFGEVRTIIGIILLLTFCLSIIFILIFTRQIVKPVKQLTKATRKVADGDYEITLDVHRRDELGNLALHFSRMAQSLRKLDDMRQAFVANVSHEIQSPLTSIQGFAQAIRTENASPEETKHYLEIIEAESRRLSSLSKQLLTLASLDSNLDLIKISTYRLDEQIREVILLAQWQWQEKELHLELNLPPVEIQGDQELLKQVWLNLITNGIKFSHHGGTLKVGIARHDLITVSITDFGVGIDEREIPYIFDRFYKGDQSRNRTSAGTGLGLSIVKKIIQLHLGSIDVKSQPEKGTTFIVRLPKL